MPLKVPDAIRVTPAVSLAASDADTSELVDTEEIYGTSKEASISEEALAQHRIACRAPKFFPTQTIRQTWNYAG